MNQFEGITDYKELREARGVTHTALHDRYDSGEITWEELLPIHAVLIRDYDERSAILKPEPESAPDYKAQYKAATTQAEKNLIFAKMLKLEDP